MCGLTADQVRGLACHVGYGSPTAPLWFVGADEGLGGRMSDEERAANLVARASWAPVMDMLAAHRTLLEDGRYIVDLIDRSGSTGVWRIMARIARAFQGARDFSDADRAAEYVRKKLGRAGGDTFLTEISPFPARVARQPRELQNFPNRELIHSVLESRRVEQLQLLSEHQPRALVCYGTALYSDLERHFGFAWQEMCTVRWHSRKSGAMQETTLHHAAIEHKAGRSTNAFLLPFFGNGALSPAVLRAFVETPKFRGCMRASNT